MVPVIVVVVALFMMLVELRRPGRDWPRVRGWWGRALLFNGLQAAVIYLAGAAWDGWMVDHQVWSADPLGPTWGALVGYLVLTFVYYWWHRARHEGPVPVALVPSAASLAAAARGHYELLQASVRARRERADFQHRDVPRHRFVAGRRRRRDVARWARGAVLPLERSDSALAWLHRATPGESLRASRGGAAPLQLRRPRAVGHHVRHVSQPGAIRGALRFWRKTSIKSVRCSSAGMSSRPPRSRTASGSRCSQPWACWGSLGTRSAVPR